MDPNAEGLPPLSLQEVVLNVNLNNGMLSILLMGIYTTVYFETLYIYLTKRSSQSRLVLATITMLYLLFVVQTSIGWYLLNRSQVIHGDTRLSAFLDATSNQPWDTLVDDICNFVSSVLADGLLIWRCYHVWDRSIRAILVSLVFLFAEIAVYLSVIILVSVHHLEPSPSVALALNNLFSAGLFMTLACTLSTTVVIAYRIYSVQQHGPPGPLRKPFASRLELLVQSAAAYSFMSLLYAIAAAVPSHNAHQNTILQMQGYIGVIFSFTACVAPTIMVARVTLAAASTDDLHQSTARISNLDFGSGGQGTTALSGSQSMAGSVHVIGGGSSSDQFQPHEK